MSLKKIRKKIIEKDLCSGCGACVGICPYNAIKFKNPYSYKPDFFDEKKCKKCGLCTAVCPALGYEMYIKSGKNQKFDKSIGYYKDFYSGFSLNKKIIKSASAGGVATETLLYLIQKKKVEKVNIVKNTKDLKKGVAYSTLTNSLKEIMEARGSKYVQVPVAKLLKKILNSDERVAIIGLPCHLAAISRAEKAIKSLKNKIIYKIGLFCGYSYNPQFVDSLFNYMGLDREEVKRVIGWREKGNPGDFVIELKNGKEKSISFNEEHSINVIFNSLLRCHLCVDWSAVYSDFSLGDIGGWKKKTFIISRTKKGKDLLEAMKKDQRIELKKLNKNYVREKTTFSFMNKAKKRRSKLFIEYLKKKEKTTPKWKIKGKNKSLIEKLYSNNYFKKIMKVRKEKSYYEKHPKLMLKKGNYLYRKFWKNLFFRLMKKIEIFLNKI